MNEGAPLTAGPDDAQPVAGEPARDGPDASDAVGDAADLLARDEPATLTPRSGSPDFGPGTGGDRCLTTDCETAPLPAQPELEFLGDLGDDWQRLMELEWELGAGAEGYRCMTLTIPRDLYIVGYKYLSPAGTHHTMMAITDGDEPEGAYTCGTGMSGTRNLGGKGAGGGESFLPPGVAMPISAGERVTMNLHLFNAGSEPLTGRSGVAIQHIPSDAVEQLASSMVAGPLKLAVPPGRSTQHATCTLPADATVFSVGPHMHELGVHMRVVAETDSDRSVLHAGAFDFAHQLHHRITPLSLSAGDRIRLECTYENDRGHTVTFGDSTRDEMCFAFLGLYPMVETEGHPCTH